MTEPGDGWSGTSLYTARGRPVEPRMFTEADPISAMIVADWSGEADGAGVAAWSDTTYVGPRRRLPKRAAAPPAPVSPEAPLGEEQHELAPQRSLLRHTKQMAVASLISRITGFLRNSLLVAALGIAQVGNAYNVANNFPNMVYELLLGGVLSSVLVPLLVRAQEDDSDDGLAYTQRLLSIATAFLGVLTLVAVACAPLLATAFVDSQHGAQRSLTSVFASLLLPEIFFYGLGAMFMAVLNVRHSYAPGAWAPVLNNIILIATVITFWVLPGPKALNPATMTTAQILVIGIGTTLGIVAQALVLIPALRATGFRWQWRFRALPNEIGRMREVGTLAFWVLWYVVASQIGVTVIAKVGVAHKAFSVFTQADLMVQMPYGILVVSLLTALMPRLSRAAARQERDAVVTDLGLGARLSAIALLPITAGLIVLGEPLAVLLFGYGRTSVAGSTLIGEALAASAFGLFPFAIVMLQLRVFYAMRDGRTPTLINVFMVGTKVAMVGGSAALFDTPRAIAIALTVSTSASYVVGAIVGQVLLTRRLGALQFGGVIGTVAKVVVASAIGAGLVYALSVGVGRWLGHGHVGSVVTLAVGAGVGIPVLAVLLLRMRIPEVRNLAGMLRGR